MPLTIVLVSQTIAFDIDAIVDSTIGANQPAVAFAIHLEAGVMTTVASSATWGVCGERPRQ